MAAKLLVYLTLVELLNDIHLCAVHTQDRALVYFTLSSAFEIRSLFCPTKFVSSGTNGVAHLIACIRLA